MRVPALDFGADSGITRMICDRCRKPVRLCYKGKDGGEYCSEACRDLGPAKVTAAPEPPKVTTAPPVKKVTSSQKVTDPKVTSASDVKVTSPAKLTSTADAAKVTGPVLSPRERQRQLRRDEIRRFCAVYTRRTGCAPSIRQVEVHLSERGLRASHRTVWLDLNAVRTGKQR